MAGQNCTCCDNRVFIDTRPGGSQPNGTMDLVIKNPSAMFYYNEARISMRSDGLLLLARELINKAIELQASDLESKDKVSEASN